MSNTQSAAQPALIMPIAPPDAAEEERVMAQVRTALGFLEKVRPIDRNIEWCQAWRRELQRVPRRNQQWEAAANALVGFEADVAARGLRSE